MEKTNRLSVIASSGLRPPAHGFESRSRHADRTTPFAKLPSIRDPANEGRLDHFIQRDGLLFAGTHLIVDLWHASNLDDLPAVELALRDAADRAGATLLNVDLHHFSPNGGISGVAVLAESHISIHTWPDIGYAALDVFMCGKAVPDACVPVLRKAFKAKRVEVSEILRGLDP